MDSQHEQKLVIQAQAGEKDALGQLWDEFTPKLFGYLINTLKDKTLAEDLLQSTWLKAIEALPRFSPRGAGFGAWLFAITRNECRQHWRKAKHETDKEITENDIIDDNRISADNKIFIDQLLYRLSEDDREILRLRYISDLPVKDIAKVLNINFITVRVRLHRAIARAKATINNQR
jgi:RNA polymerase sigma-70 factor (ECF subfamily)